MRVVDAVREAAAAGLNLATPCDAFVRIVEHLIAVVEDRLIRLTAQLDHMEDVVLSDRDDVDVAGIGPVRRELSRYRREFSGLRTALTRAQRAPGGAPQTCPVAPHLPALALAAEDFDRDAGALADRAPLLYEEVDIRIAARTNRSLSALTILSTLLLPATFIAGAFGMNLIDITSARTRVASGGRWACASSPPPPATPSSNASAFCKINRNRTLREAQSRAMTALGSVFISRTLKLPPPRRGRGNTEASNKFHTERPQPQGGACVAPLSGAEPARKPKTEIGNGKP